MLGTIHPPRFEFQRLIGTRSNTRFPTPIDLSVYVFSMYRRSMGASSMRERPLYNHTPVLTCI